jgi:hypothetical protein
MAISYNWTVSNTDRRTSDGFIQVAHWQCTGADGDITSSVYATCSFEGDVNIPYASVTEADVLGWCWANGVDKDATEASIADRIEALKNPVQASGLPWAAA